MITNAVPSAADLESQFETVDPFPAAKRPGGDLSRWSRAPTPPEVSLADPAKITKEELSGAAPRGYECGGKRTDP